MRNRFVSVLILAALVSVAAPAVAQERSIGNYDREIGAKYAGVWENPGTWGHGFLVDGGMGLKLCGFWGWQCQVVGEVMAARFDYWDSTYTQFVAGVRYGRLMSPKLRVFLQFQAGAQNDGRDATATLVMPGGGISYALTRRFDVNFTVDGPVALYENDTFNQARLAIGIGIPFGGN